MKCIDYILSNGEMFVNDELGRKGHWIVFIFPGETEEYQGKLQSW